MNDLNACFVIPQRVGHQKQGKATDCANGLPALLAVLDAILACNGHWIGEDANGLLKGNAMLAQVAGGFGWIPREALAHGHCNPFLYIQMLAVLVSGKQDLRLVDSGKAAWLPLVSTVGRKNAGSN